MAAQVEAATPRSIFLAAIMLRDDQARQMFVGLVCRDDDALKEKVCQLLTAWQSGFASPIDAVVQNETGEISVPALDVEDSATAGKYLGATALEAVIQDVSHHPEIGPYKLLEQIGMGGFGTVYLAEQSVPVRRKVALKILRPGMDSNDLVARFEAERQALAMMDHPHIAKVFDGGTDNLGRPFFVMELVRGIPVTEYCDEVRLTTNERLELFVDVCRAVQHAHLKGIIHRDLKPSNVLVSQIDGKPVAKVIDFGIAKALGHQLTDRSLHTGFAQLVGTPLYMSPEQASLSGVDVDTRSDVYSLGVMLYELLTGTTPFDKESLSNASFDELRKIIQEQEPPCPSARVTTLNAQARSTIADRRRIVQRKVSDELRGELDWIVMKALEKDRNRRYESVSDFAQDIQRYLSDEPVQACPPTLAYRLRKYAQRNRTGVSWAIGVLLAILLCGTLIAYPGYREAKRLQGVRQHVELALRGAETAIEAGDLVLADKAVGSATTLLSQDQQSLHDIAARVKSLSAELGRRQSDQIRFDELLSRARDAQDRMTYGKHLGGNGIATEALHEFSVLERDDWLQVLESSYLSSEQKTLARETIYETLLCLADYGPRWVRTEDSVRHSLDLLSHAEQFHASTKALHWVRSECCQVLNETEASEQALTKYDATPPTSALDYYLPGHTAGWRGNRKAASQAYREALRIQPDHYNSLFFLADRTAADKHYAEAIAYYTGCVALRPSHVFALSSRAEAYEKAGEQQAAELDYLAATNVQASHDDQVYAFDTLLDFYRRTYQHEKHAAALVRLRSSSQRLVADQTAQAGPDDPVTWEVISKLGKVLCEAGAFDEGITLLRRALQERRRLFAGSHEKTGISLNNLGLWLSRSDRPAEAVPLLEEAVSVCQSLYGREHHSTLTAMTNLGDAYTAAGEAFRAIPLLQEAVAGFQKLDKVENTLGPMHSLGNAFCKSNEWDKAVPILEEVFTLRVRFSGAEHFKTLEAMNTLGDACTHTGQFARGIPLLKDALEKHQRLFGSESPQTLGVTRNLAFAYLSEGRSETAAELLQETLQTHSDRLGQEHPSTLNVLHNLGTALIEADRPGEAIPLLARSLESHQHQFGLEHAETLLARTNLAAAYLVAGQFDDAVDLYQAILETHTRLHGATDPRSLDAAGELVFAYQRASRREEGMQLARSWLATTRTQSDEIRLSSALAVAAETLLKFEEFAEAESLARECLEIRAARLANTFRHFNAQSLLGGALLGQGKVADAETLLRQAMAGFDQQRASIPRPGMRNVTRTLEQLVKLYESTHQLEDVERWKARLHEIEETQGF